jgi:hypothetical protein
MNAPHILQTINFAFVGENRIVINVTCLPSYTSEQQGIEYLTAFYANDPEYNVAGGGWYRQDLANPKRKAAGIGATYNPELDAFIAPCPFPSWTLDAETFQWIPPSPQPSPFHGWDEATLSWIKVYPET